MSRTTDSLKYLFGRTGSYIDESGTKKPLPYDKKFLKKFFKSRLIDRLIKEGTNAFDVSRFAPVADYIDTLHIVYNTDGTIKEASVITNVGTVIDCIVEVQFFYAMLYVTAGAKASDTGEWLGNNASNVIYYNKRSSYTGTAQWNAGRSIDGLDAIAYYYNDGTTTGICCETTDGNAGTFKLAQNMLYHLFNGANVEVIEGFSNAINNMVWGDDCAYMDGTFENLKTTDTTASEITLDLDWIINKWHCASINFSTDGDTPLNIIWPENLQGINTTNDGYTIWINAILTSECWVRLANNLAMHNDGDAWKATIKVEKEEQAVNLLTETKEMIETKGWAIDIPKPATGWYTQATLDFATDKIVGVREQSSKFFAITSDGYVYTSSNGTEWSRSAGQLTTTDGTVLGNIASFAVDQQYNVYILLNYVDKVFTDYYVADTRDIYSGTFNNVTKVTLTGSDGFYNASIVDGGTGAMVFSKVMNESRYIKPSSNKVVKNMVGPFTFGNLDGWLGNPFEGYLFVDASLDGSYEKIADLPMSGTPKAICTKDAIYFYIAFNKGISEFNGLNYEGTQIVADITGSNIDKITVVNNDAIKIVASAGKVLHGTTWDGTFEDTGLTYTNNIELVSFEKKTVALADGVLYVKVIE